MARSSRITSVQRRLTVGLLATVSLTLVVGAAALLTQAAQVDAALKGVFPAEPWATLTGLLIAMLSQPEKA